MKNLAFIFLILIPSFRLVAQKYYQVQHIQGTKTINNTQVTVRPFGQIAILDNMNYCEGKTGPYYFGYNYNNYTSAYGGYEFTFNPPALAISINVTGLSADNDNMEEVKFFVNGKHYPIPSKGNKIACEEMAVLTPKGNIRPCRDCSISGWEGTYIEGPITTFKVTDTIFSGSPAGALIALYLVQPANNTAKIYRHKLADLHAGLDIPITSTTVDLLMATITLTDDNGSKLNIHHWNVSDEHHANLYSTEFNKGTYTLTIRSDSQTEIQQIIIE